LTFDQVIEAFQTKTVVVWTRSEKIEVVIAIYATAIVAITSNVCVWT
jgi:hypothetical protein